jgi:hypothetical protein
MEHFKKERPKHRLLESFDKGCQYVPYQQQQYNQSSVQGASGTTNNAYTAGQTGLQNNLGSMWQSLLSGNIPSSFTNPAAATNAYQSNFQTQVAPGLAAQYGAGSPVIGSQNALGLAQLQGNLYNSGVNNFLGAMGSGTNYALGMPTGTGSTQAQSGQSSGSQTTGINPLAFLSSILAPYANNLPSF